MVTVTMQCPQCGFALNIGKMLGSVKSEKRSVTSRENIKIAQEARRKKKSDRIAAQNLSMDTKAESGLTPDPTKLVSACAQLAKVEVAPISMNSPKSERLAYLKTLLASPTATKPEIKIESEPAEAGLRYEKDEYCS
jgi:hypothetical protein